MGMRLANKGRNPCVKGLEHEDEEVAFGKGEKSEEARHCTPARVCTPVGG